MKKTYKTLDSELLLVETEGGFMGSSVRINTNVTVEEYKAAEWETATYGSHNLDDGSWDITFE